MHAAAEMLKVNKLSELLSAQYLTRCLEPKNVSHSIITRDPPRDRMKETLFTNDDRNTPSNVMFAYLSTVRKIDDHPPTINNTERTMKECATVAQRRTGYCRLLGSCKSMIKKDASLNT